jgi:imidazolonepropionase-like amidohydrolase
LLQVQSNGSKQNFSKLSQMLTLSNINVITCNDNQRIERADVVVNGDRIAEISPHAPRTANLIDCSGRYLIPGLWDMHAHVTFYGRDSLKQMLAHGVTGVRDMGGNIDLLDQWRREIGSEERPKLFVAGAFIDGQKATREDRSRATIVVDTEDEAISAARKMQARGVDFLKVHSRLPRAAFIALMDEAKRLDMDVAVHLPATSTIDDVIDGHVRSLEHADAFLESAIYIEDEATQMEEVTARLEFLSARSGAHLLRRFADSHTWLAPTLVSYATVFADGTTPFERLLPGRLIELTRQLHRFGVPMLAGTDFAWPEVGISPGADLHRELGLLVDAGLTELEALQTATCNAARCLRQEADHGTVEVGKVADLVVLNADPLADIAHVAAVHATLRRGRYHAWHND